ncbi:DUF5683 domain-containing protein [Saccharicrinis fermentans]|uniref:DUF5683 domain-containing protein n=1 Tax=Saccharicrinis fermentans TaxID=982 RepID=UPI001267865C|nr:DUF5683 domain-containing protein [Saccharicrinis fermentans]
MVAIFFVTMLGYSHETSAQNNEFNIVSADTVVSTPVVSKPLVVKTHSPHKATFYSAILPGLGQAYNKKYWKIPILYAGIGGVIYGLDFNSSNYKKYRRAYRDYLLQDPGNQSYLNDNVRPRSTSLEEFKELLETDSSYADWFESALENKRDYYKKYRDLSYVGLALVYVLNLVDASVDAHFKTFDVSNDLSMHIEPTTTPMYGGYNSIGMQIRFTF